MAILRYPKNDLLTSGQDPFLDMLNWLGFLCAKEYLVGLLQRAHGLSLRDARKRAVLIIPHVRIAIGYIRQSLDGPSDIAFLPAYYAILNLMKVYVLLGPRHADLPKHRWHGATYDVHSKDSQSILTEVITLKKSGVFPLFYETITGNVLTTNEVRLQMKDVLPYLSGVSYEYALATGLPASLCYLKLDYVSKQNRTYPQITIGDPPGGRRIPKNQLKVLRDFRGQRDQPNVFLGTHITDPSKKDEETRAQLKLHLIYRYHPQSAYTPICSKKIEFPEELPIALTFFIWRPSCDTSPSFLVGFGSLNSGRCCLLHGFIRSMRSFSHSGLSCSNRMFS